MESRSSSACGAMRRRIRRIERVRWRGGGGRGRSPPFPGPSGGPIWRRRIRWSRGLLRLAELCGGASGGSSEFGGEAGAAAILHRFCKLLQGFFRQFAAFAAGQGGASVGEAGEEGDAATLPLFPKGKSFRYRFLFAAQATVRHG